MVLLLALAWTAVMASTPLNDNSFFTHLATGRLILDTGSVPGSDPYTFTAAGEPWTVQSWLPSVAYAALERLAGDLGLRLLVLALHLVTTLLVWRLTRPATSLILRASLVAGALVVATGLWSERPLMIGVLGVALVWLALDHDAPALLLVPFMWMWVNSHGSWILAPALVALYVTGASLDGWRERRRLRLGGREKRVAIAVAVGSLLGAVGPLGIDALVFPLRSLRDTESFDAVIEWQAPNFDSVSELAFLVLTGAAMLLLARAGSFRLAVPAVAFTVAALYAQRNIVVATVVLVAAAARAAPTFGSLTSWTRPALGSAVAALAGAVLVVASGVAVTSPALTAGALDGYPANALGWLSAEGLGEIPAVAEMRTGNLLEVLDGRSARVFIDDRVDMFPQQLLDDFLVLERGQPGWSSVLDRHDIDMVVWDRQDPLGSLLVADPAWMVSFGDPEWVVACRRGAPFCDEGAVTRRR